MIEQLIFLFEAFYESLPPVETVMKYTYPLHAGIDFALSISLFVFGAQAIRTRLFLMLLPLVFALNGISMTLLSMSAGLDPIISIEHLRPFIAHTRNIEWVLKLTMIFSIWWQIRQSSRRVHEKVDM